MSQSTASFEYMPPKNQGLFRWKDIPVGASYYHPSNGLKEKTYTASYHPMAVLRAPLRPEKVTIEVPFVWAEVRSGSGRRTTYVTIEQAEQVDEACRDAINDTPYPTVAATPKDGFVFALWKDVPRDTEYFLGGERGSTKTRTGLFSNLVVVEAKVEDEITLTITVPKAYVDWRLSGRNTAGFPSSTTQADIDEAFRQAMAEEERP